jgi:DNA-binding GntR family transcriptional regulator
VTCIATQTTLKDKAYNELKTRILNGELKAGEMLTERVMVDLLGMSRTPIRAAVERLAAEGLLNYTPNKGIVVPEVSINRAANIYDLRTALEVHIVSRLSERELTRSETQRLEENLLLQKEYAGQLQFDKFTAKDSEFHRTLAEMYGNTEMLSVIERIQDQIYHIAMQVLRKDRNRVHVSYTDHRAIYDAVLEHNGAKAAAMMVDHLRFGKQILAY